MPVVEVQDLKIKWNKSAQNKIRELNCMEWIKLPLYILHSSTTRKTTCGDADFLLSQLHVTMITRIITLQP
jgi:hypothetical protein